jgi:hypothetical protein
VAKALFFHYESKTRGKTNTPDKKRREELERLQAVSLHEHLLTNDPFYSKNLSKSVLYGLPHADPPVEHHDPDLLL